MRAAQATLGLPPVPTWAQQDKVTPTLMPTPCQPSLLRSHGAIPHSSCRTHRSSYQLRHQTLPGFSCTGVNGFCAPAWAATALFGLQTENPEPLRCTGFWCHGWSCAVPSTKKNENERSYRGCRQLAESTRALPHRLLVRFPSPREIQALGSAGWMWQVSPYMSLHLWKAPTYLSGLCAAELSWNEKGN